jgi:hypothetical protein
VSWSDDPAGIVARKLAKQLLSLPPLHRLLFGLCRTAERVAPDGLLSWRLYDLAVAEAISRGVREGLERYHVSKSP